MKGDLREDSRGGLKLARILRSTVRLRIASSELEISSFRLEISLLWNEILVFELVSCCFYVKVTFNKIIASFNPLNAGMISLAEETL